MGDLYVARQGFSAASPKGEKVTVYQGDTVEEGHFLLTGRSDLFYLQEVTYAAPAKAESTKQGTAAAK